MDVVSIQLNVQDVAMVRELLSMATASGGVNANRIARCSLYIEGKIDRAIEDLRNSQQAGDSAKAVETEGT